jgi:hypothetical protein
MKVELKDVEEDYTTCNFCNISIEHNTDKGIVSKRPYTKVIEFSNTNNYPIVVSICKNCLFELCEKGVALFNRCH